MSSYRQLCNPQSCVPCNVTCPQPFVDACNQPCVTSCGDSSAVVYPPPIVVNFPGPILATCPQESVVGSSAPYGIRSSLGLGGSSGSRSLYNYGGSYAPGLSARASGCVYPSASQQFTTYHHGSCRPYQTQK